MRQKRRGGGGSAPACRAPGMARQQLPPSPLPHGGGPGCSQRGEGDRREVPRHRRGARKRPLAQRSLPRPHSGEGRRVSPAPRWWGGERTRPAVASAGGMIDGAPSQSGFAAVPLEAPAPRGGCPGGGVPVGEPSRRAVRVCLPRGADCAVSTVGGVGAAPSRGEDGGRAAVGAPCSAEMNVLSFSARGQ